MMIDRQGYQASKEKKLALHSQPASDKPYSRLQAQAWAREAAGEDGWSLVLGLGALLTRTTCYLCPAAQGSWLNSRLFPYFSWLLDPWAGFKPCNYFFLVTVPSSLEGFLLLPQLAK